MDIIVIIIVICLLIASLSHYMGKKHEEACKQLTEMRDHARANPPPPPQEDLLRQQLVELESRYDTLCEEIRSRRMAKNPAVLKVRIAQMLSQYEAANGVQITSLQMVNINGARTVQIDARPVRDA